MATDFYAQRNSFGGPLMGPTKAGEPTNNPPPPQDQGIFGDMLRVANRDLADRPTELAAKTAEIHSLAEAMGRPFPAPDQRSDAVRTYDGLWNKSDTAQTGADPATGYPAALQPAAIKLWQTAPDTRPPSYMPAGAADPARAEALKVTTSWLSTAASPERAKELLGLAERNVLVLRALSAHAYAHQRYAAGRPKS
jgi:hypothetical protein